jgi:HSP20 family molecular chaperone IbpA
MMRILFLPDEFSELLHLQTKHTFDPYTQVARVGEKLVVRMALEDFTEDDVVVAVAKDALVIIGTRYPASFCMHFGLPSDAEVENIQSTMAEGILQIEIPLKAGCKEGPEKPSR